MKRVVCLGGKPAAVIPDGDILYCSNTSIGLYAPRVKHFAAVILVTIKPALDLVLKHQGPDDRYGDFYRLTWQAIVSIPQKIICISSRSITTMRNRLIESGFQGSLEHMTKFDRRTLIARVSGCGDPVLTSEFWGLPQDMQRECLWSVVKVGFRRIFSKKADSHCVLRPSTGVLTLIYAISEHGEKAHYVVAGVGLTKRGEYSQGKNESKEKQNPYAHILADKKVLRALAKRYHVSTTEPELMDILPAFHTWL